MRRGGMGLDGPGVRSYADIAVVTAIKLMVGVVPLVIPAVSGAFRDQLR